MSLTVEVYPTTTAKGCEILVMEDYRPSHSLRVLGMFYLETGRLPNDVCV